MENERSFEVLMVAATAQSVGATPQASTEVLMAAASSQASSDIIQASSNMPIQYVEAERSELLGVEAKSEEDSYTLYNDYAFKIGFGIRQHNYRFKANTDIVKGKEFVCSKHGVKKERGKIGKQYTKLNVRTNCKARVYFEIRDGKWVCVRHHLIHNHPFFPPDQIHLINSHRQITMDQFQYLKELVDAGVDVIAAIRAMTKAASGSPYLGFTERDVYNKLETEKKKTLDGTDSNTLIQIFRKRQADEEDFYYAFEIDEDSSLVSFFWRDKKMKQNYEAFGDLMIHDTTYRTNRYDMICAPFVGMNNHTNNCMFACGFLLNEKTESFVWLFEHFLQSMDGVAPQTIRLVFPSSKHRLCTWHLAENSRNHIRTLRNTPGFMDIFNHVLMYCDSIAEFEHFWARMLQQFNCENNEWLLRLYSMKEKWCSVFSRDRFSGGALSSQRAKATNNVVSHNLTKTAALCDFYKCFAGVDSEWESKVKKEDTRCFNGFPEMAIDNIPLLMHATRVYSIEAYKEFERRYLSGLSCQQQFHQINFLEITYIVWKPQFELFAHQVHYNVDTILISCTCRKFDETAMLCCHALRIFSVHSVQLIPDVYIARRWTRTARVNLDQPQAVPVEQRTTGTSVASVWKHAMRRKLNALLDASDNNEAARRCCDELFEAARNNVQAHVGDIYLSEDEEDAESSVIKNPKKSKKKHESNKRRKSIVEKKKNQARTRRRITSTYGLNQQSMFVETVLNPIFVNPPN